MNRKIRTLASLLKRGKAFGYTLMLSYFVTATIGRWLPRRVVILIAKWQQKRVIEIICSFMSELNFSEKRHSGNQNRNGTIWVCWLQGEDRMPKIPQLCLQSIRKYAAGHEVVVLTADNYKDYVTLPSHIEEKYKRGILSPAHFSDCIRINLLCQRGGLWLDATMLTVRPIEDEVFELPFFSVKTKETDNYISKCRWTVFCVATPSHGHLIECTASALNRYWEKWDSPVDYLFLDYIIDYLYDHDSEIKQMIDAVPFNNPYIHEMRDKMGVTCNLQELAELCKSNYWFKLNWRLFADEVLEARETYFQYFKKVMENG